MQRTAEPGQRRTKCENPGKEPGLVDAERTDHLTILGRSADQNTHTGAGHEIPEAHGDQGRDCQKGKVVFRDRLAHHPENPSHPGGARPEEVVRSPDDQREILNDQNDAEGRDKLEQLRGPVDRAQHQHFDKYADSANNDARQQD